MLEDLQGAERGTIVLLHACCHNPTGCDLENKDWDRVLEVVREHELLPFLDMAYQGLAYGLEQDRYAVSLFGEAGIPFVVANSFSKNFALYGERVGGIHFVADDEQEAQRVLSQAKIVVRSLYSNPPTQGAAIVSTILNSPELHGLWDRELDAMRERIKTMREAFRHGLEGAGITQDLSYITVQEGLFSYSGLSVEQMTRLREEFHVYGLDSGRLCVAGLNESNMDYVVSSVATVMGS
jgi:aromatic-amino-acid transaminase